MWAGGDSYADAQATPYGHANPHYGTYPYSHTHSDGYSGDPGGDSAHAYTYTPTHTHPYGHGGAAAAKPYADGQGYTHADCYRYSHARSPA